MVRPPVTEAPKNSCLRYLLRTLHVLLFISLLLSGCATGKSWKYLPATKAEERSVYVVAHGWHTGIVLSREELGDALGFVPEYLGQGPYYEFGWGEAEFYQADRVTPSIFLKTVFWRNPSVVHVALLRAAPQEVGTGSDVVQLTVSVTGLGYMRQRLRETFTFDEKGRPYPLKHDDVGAGMFFKAQGYYLIVNTCNLWTARVLASGGVPMDTVFTLRAASVMRQVRAARKLYAAPLPP